MDGSSLPDFADRESSPALLSSYCSTALYADRGKIISPPNFRQSFYRPALHFIFHKIGSRVLHRGGPQKKDGSSGPRRVLAGQFDVAEFLGE